MSQHFTTRAVDFPAPTQINTDVWLQQQYRHNQRAAAIALERLENGEPPQPFTFGITSSALAIQAQALKYVMLRMRDRWVDAHAHMHVGFRRRQ